jgi:hypothetical protein
MSAYSESMRDRGILRTLTLAMIMSSILLMLYAVICSCLEQGTPINLRWYHNFLTSGGVITNYGSVRNPRWLHDSYYCFTLPYDGAKQWLSRRRAAKILPGKWTDGRTMISFDERLELTLLTRSAGSANIAYRSSSMDFGIYSKRDHSELVSYVMVYPTDTDDVIQCRILEGDVKSNWFTLERLR